MLTLPISLQDRYILTKMIGSGGAGWVYEGRDKRLRNRVAVKQLQFSDEEMVKNFEREAHLLASLRHNALPKIIDYFTEHSSYFLVMEYIDGDDLANQMKYKKFSVDEIILISKQLLDILLYLHNRDYPVIHRDIKPGNIKILPNNLVMLLDFGLAKSNVLTTQKLSSVRGYTPQYASLEQIQGSGTSIQSDIYSFGATLYHLFTGIIPVDALTRATALLNGQDDPIKKIHLINSSIPLEIANVVMECLNISYSNRPKSITAIIQRFQTTKQSKIQNTRNLKIAGITACLGIISIGLLLTYTNRIYRWNLNSTSVIEASQLPLNLSMGSNSTPTITENSLLTLSVSSTIPQPTLTEPLATLKVLSPTTLSVVTKEQPSPILTEPSATSRVLPSTMMPVVTKERPSPTLVIPSQTQPVITVVSTEVIPTATIQEVSISTNTSIPTLIPQPPVDTSIDGFYSGRTEYFDDYHNRIYFSVKNHSIESTGFEFVIDEGVGCYGRYLRKLGTDPVINFTGNALTIYGTAYHPNGSDKAVYDITINATFENGLVYGNMIVSVASSSISGCEGTINMGWSMTKSS